jgi:P27 family predicted phage terminase small subunit
MRGRPPKPTALKILQGNPGKRLLNQKEPQPQKALLKCPRWLNKFAREEWASVVPELHRLGLLTKLVEKALACYCQAYSRLRQAEAVIAKKGITFKTPNGFVQKRPEVTIAREAMQRCCGQCHSRCRQGRWNKPKPSRWGYAWLRRRSIDTGSASIGVLRIHSQACLGTILKSVRGLSEFNVGRVLAISATWQVPALKLASRPAGWIVVAHRGDSATCDAMFGLAYGSIHVVFRAGLNPTEIRAISFRDLISTTETSFVCSLDT